MLRNIVYAIIFLFFSTVLNAENHQKNLVDQEFKTAIKHVEKKRFFEAFKIFSNLSEEGIPEHNIIYLYSI